MAYLISEEAQDLLQDVKNFCDKEVAEQCKEYDVSGEWPKAIYDKAVEQGYQAARLCAMNIITHVRSACGGDLDRVKRCLRVGGFVNAVPDFTDHPKVINGASDLLVEVFGEAGKHARAAVGMGSLPGNIAVEIEAIFEVE